MTFLSQVPIDTVGYAALRFAFHPGELIGTPVSFTMGMNGQTTRIWGENQEETRVDLNRREWQLVEIPLEEATFFGRTRRLGSVTLTGRMGGTFYLDDLRLVARQSPVTAVQEERSASLPETFDLQQNYPNPFNSSTVIRFALPTTADVKLSIFNLTGQQIATLADGIRATGTYTLHWDGRNDDDQPLASGVYLYRLQTGDGQQQMRKLLLLH
jgi:hypothetical protein